LITARRLAVTAAVLAALMGACAEPPPAPSDPLQETLAIAESGDPVAQTVVGSLFEAGAFGVPDPRTAAFWYEKAVRQGDALAAFHLAVLLEDGRGVARDYAAAAMLYRRAAQAGHGSAAFKLGYLYEKGLGVEQDFLEARSWYDVAQQGWSDAGINPFMPAYLLPSADPEVIDAGLPVVTPPEPVPDLPAVAAATPEPAPVPAPVSSPPATVSAPAPSPPEPELAAGYHVHLGSEKSVAAAMEQWESLQARFGDLLGGFAPALAKLQLAGGTTYYQIMAGPLDAEAEADVLCAQLQPQGQYCNTIPPPG
jgi:hypothetical protein